MIQRMKAVLVHYNNVISIMMYHVSSTAPSLD